MSLLARLFPCPHTTPTLAVQLAECRGDLLTTERRATRLAASLEAYTGHFLRASRRAEAMTTERDRLKGDNDQLRERLSRHERLLEERPEYEELQGRVRYLEQELRDMERSRENLTDIADGLRNELKAVKARKGKR